MINKLLVKGVRKDYEVSFNNHLNIIAGEISTGKSSVLDIIDYCFGAKESPEYPELSRNGRTSLLECNVANEAFTIERQLFSTSRKAFIHKCRISDLKSNHELIEVDSQQIKSGESISKFMI
jgi:DNA repair ATPase RecN